MVDVSNPSCWARDEWERIEADRYEQNWTSWHAIRPRVDIIPFTCRREVTPPADRLAATTKQFIRLVCVSPGLEEHLGRVVRDCWEESKSKEWSCRYSWEWEWLAIAKIVQHTKCLRPNLPTFIKMRRIHRIPREWLDVARDYPPWNSTTMVLSIIGFLAQEA